MPLKMPGTPDTAPTPGLAATSKPTQAQVDEAYINAADAKRQQAAAPTPIRAAAPVGQRPPASRTVASTQYPDEGVGDAPPPSENGEGLPFANTFGNLAAGSYKFICCVEAITHWRPSEPTVTFRVHVGKEAGREVRWDQSPPPYAVANPEGAGATHWKRALFGAYAAGGWPAEPDEAKGWAGWPRNAANGYVPPYADFFVVPVDGRAVPIMLEVSVRVDQGYEQYTKVTAVRPLLIDGTLVQAPMPRKVTPWIAARHRWEGEQADITVKPSNAFPNGATIPSVKVRWDQYQRGLGGMLGLKDIRA